MNKIGERLLFNSKEGKNIVNYINRCNAFNQCIQIEIAAGTDLSDPFQRQGPAGSFSLLIALHV